MSKKQDRITTPGSPIAAIQKAADTAEAGGRMSYMKDVPGMGQAAQGRSE